MLRPGNLERRVKIVIGSSLSLTIATSELSWLKLDRLGVEDRSTENVEPRMGPSRRSRAREPRLWMLNSQRSKTEGERRYRSACARSVHGALGVVTEVLAHVPFTGGSGRSSGAIS
jgi:hypothetical protein